MRKQVIQVPQRVEPGDFPTRPSRLQVKNCYFKLVLPQFT